MQRSNRKKTATLTASSSNLRPQEAIGSAKSQSPLCSEEAAAATKPTTPTTMH